MTNIKKDEKVNMKMLARMLNLSTATISKALRDSYEISAETKARVLEAATKLNYIPNPFASSLRNNRSKTIAIVLPEIADSFFSQAINGIETVVNEHQYHALIYLSHENYARELLMFSELNSGRVDGVLLSLSCETRDTAHISKVLNAGLPVVLFDRVCDDIPVVKIKTDDYESAYKATTHLLEQGCTAISLITIAGYPSMLEARASGYRQALLDHQVEPDSGNVVICANKYTAETTVSLKDHFQKYKPDGIVITVEHLATSAYLACKELQLSIPADMKMICFTNQLNAEILNPALSTIQQPAFEMGRQAAIALFRQLTGKETELTEMVLPSVLIARASTAR